VAIYRLRWQLTLSAKYVKEKTVSKKKTVISWAVIEKSIHITALRAKSVRYFCDLQTTSHMCTGA